MSPRRISLLLLLSALLLVSLCGGCRNKGGRSTGGTGGGGTGGEAGEAEHHPAATGPEYQLTLLFSATESDPWTSELINTIGDSLKIDPWKSYSQQGHLDVYGPYACDYDGRKLKLSIGLCGLTGVSDLLAQQVLGEEARKWVVSTSPDLVWLDGDQAQFMVGREMDPKLPILFTGTVGEADIYYDAKRPVTGVYRRYSLSKVMAEIWKLNHDANTVALLSDASSSGQAQRNAFRMQLELLMPGTSKRQVPDPVVDWAQLKEQLNFPSEANAFIVCGLSPLDAPAGLRGKPVPADLLKGVKRTVVALGPSLLDEAGVPSLRLVPSAHAREALKLALRVLGGTDPRSLLPVTPEEMQVYVSK